MKSDSLRFLGYREGDIGRLTLLHATYYHEHWGFDLSFEAQVARELSEFLLRADPARDHFEAAWLGERFLGGVAIDGSSTPEQGARLRWFMVDPESQGRGVGRALIARALDFCRAAGHRRVYLWTFQGLEPARRLYQDAGFILAEEHQVQQWGNLIIEQLYQLDLGEKT